MIIRVWHIQSLKVRQLHYLGDVGEWSHLLMTYSLSINSAKSYVTNRIVLVLVIVVDKVLCILKQNIFECE